MKHITKTIVFVALCLCIFGCKPSKEEIEHRKNVALLAKVAKQEEAARKESFVYRRLANEAGSRARKGLAPMTKKEVAALIKKLEIEFDKK